MSDLDKAHSLFAPSGAEARLLCVGKLAMEKGLPDISSEYADEGTAAHTVGSTALIEEKNATDYLGWKLKVQGSRNSPVREFTNDESMAGFVQTYIDTVRTYAVGSVYFKIEERVNFGRLIEQPEADSFGTGDVFILTEHVEQPGCYELQMHDLKYGIGVKVFARKNAQLLHYALGAWDFLRYFYNITSIRLCIHQPRLGWFDEWTCTVEEMLGHAEIFKENAKLVRQLYEAAELMTPDNLRPYLKAGEKQCMFCKAQAFCPEAQAKVTNLLALNFQSFDLESDKPGSRIDLLKLGQAMDGVPFIEGWCKAVRAEVERELFAGRAAVGEKGPYKLVHGRRGPRKFKQTDAVISKMKAHGLEHHEMYDYSLKTPPQLEQVYKPKRGKQTLKPGLWEALQPYIDQADPSISVAPADDPRDSVSPSANADLLLEHFKEETE